MTLDGLLAIAGVLVAILAIADPVQLRSILLFVPVKVLIMALGASLVAVMYARAVDDWQIRTPPWSLFLLRSGSFLAPVLAIIDGVREWHRAKLSEKKVGRFREVTLTALRQGVYDELERILRRNEGRLNVLPLAALHPLFDRKVVRALLDARSFLHLELLTDAQLLDSAGRSRFLFVDNVVRELLLSPNSPWRSAVIWKHGGHDSWTYLDEERNIVDDTLQNPSWYVNTSAHGPLVNTAIGAVQTGRLDLDYNQIGRAYESREGISPHADCPVFLALKMEVLAIRAAVRQRYDADFYVTDLSHVFRTIRDHSVYDEAVWKSPLANREFPTPYAYLLHEVYCDLRSLIWEALSASLERPQEVSADEVEALRRLAEATAQRSETSEPAVPPEKQRKIRQPVRIDQQVALTWSYCAWEMARAQGRVGEDFRIGMIREYLNLVLQLHCQPSEIPELRDSVVGLEPWRDLLLEEIRQRFAGSPHQEKEALARAFRSLDRGKEYVRKGRDWLALRLGLAQD